MTLGDFLKFQDIPGVENGFVIFQVIQDMWEAWRHHGKVGSRAISRKV